MKAICLVLFMTGVAAHAQSVTWSPSNPPAQVALAGEGFISTSLNERDFAIAPDGTEIYFTISTPRSTFQTIVVSRKLANGQWTKPEVASFAGVYSDLEPAFSADGNTLYFASNRPVQGTAPKDFDIWRVKRTSTGWGVPENLGAPVNTEADEFYPSITRSGNLYFTAAYAGGPGREDIYVARPDKQNFLKPVALDTAVNSKFYEFNAHVTADERYILFTSYGRKDDAGGGDLYISVKDAHGNWQRAVNLQVLNSRQLDYCPYVSPDGRALFFTSERHQLPVSFTAQPATYAALVSLASSPLNSTGNIYWIDFKKVLEQAGY